LPFIVFEGIDGCGKTTQASFLESFLSSKGVPVLRVREPGSTPLGERIRGLLLDPSLEIDGWVETLLYFACRRSLSESLLKGALEKGFYVLLERFTLSTFAYQGYLRGVDLGFIEDLERRLIKLPQDPIYILLDLPADLALSRKARSDRIESEPLSFFRRLRDAYLELSLRRKDVRVVDASGSPEEVFSRVLELLRREGLL